MSGRKIGGGRVLGSGRSLSPAVSPSPTPSGSSPSKHLAVQHARNSSLLSPTASSVSLDSSPSSSLTSTGDDRDLLASRISLETNGTSSASAAAQASSRLVCPICNEEMVTLLQLNRHLDDNHKNLEEIRQDEVKDWFKTQMVKAKKFQPLAVLNQKLKGLDVFESNDEPDAPSLPVSVGPVPARPVETGPPRMDPDEVVTQVHWQRQGPNDACSEPMCGKRLNVTNGKVNCRKCGKLFCEDHTMYQIKLSRSAQHEPVHGLWCRVCETCYKSRDGYNDHNGFERDHTKAFTSIRRKVVDKNFLEVSRLEKRLTRLTQLLANPPEQNASTGGLLWPLNPIKNQRKELEQSVVTWEDDATVARCPFCQQDFSNYVFRRHHCRTCGRVVCADPATQCSTEVGFNVDTVRGPEKSNEKVSIDIRMCKDCKHTVFSRRDFETELSKKPADVRAYENLAQFERGIRVMLPKFQRLLSTLQDPDKPPTPNQISEASRVRKRLMDSFTQYDIAARRIRDLPSESQTQKDLQKKIYQAAFNFLHLHMLPLKSLPKILKHASPHPGHAQRPSLTSNGSNSRPPSALAAIKFNDSYDASSQASSTTAISQLEEEEKSLRDRLIILEEQKFFVTEMIAQANKKRRFEEVSALAVNVQELSKEIDQIQGQLAQLDFEGVYTGLASPGPVPKR